MNADKRLEIFTRLRAENPNPVTELNYQSPFELLIAVLLSAQATDVSVNLATAEHEGQVPSTRAALEALPGVGRKTANVVLNTAFRQVAMAVDTHIFRVSNRTRIATGKDVLAVEQKLLRHVPKEFLLDAHHWLILHGRYTCVARKPRCGSCLIEDLCEYRDKTESV